MAKPKKVTFDTRPTDMKYRRLPWRELFKTIVREVIAGNLPRHHGTEAAVHLFRYKGEYYVGIVTNCDPFESLEELIDPGCTCNRTYLEGNANQGNGLPTVTMAASEFIKNPVLVLGSWCGEYPNDEFLCAKGCPDKNLWQSVAAVEWPTIIRKFYGKRFLEQTDKNKTKRLHTVFNIFKITIPENNPALRVADMVAVMFSAYNSIPNGLRWYLGETLIDVDKGENLSDQVYDPNRHKPLGNRRMASYGEYMARFGDVKATMPCTTFKIDYDDEQFLQFEGCAFEVEAYPGLERGGWLTNLQQVGGDAHDEDMGYGKKGGSSGMGKRPEDKVYIIFPNIYHEIASQDKDIAHSYERYLDNALGTYGQPERIFRECLGLQYYSDFSSPKPLGIWANDPAFGEDDERKACNQKPFLIGRAIINGKVTLINKKTKEEKTIDAFSLLAMLDRRGDFYADNLDLIRKITKGAARAAREAVPQALKNWCTAYFPLEERSYMPILLNDFGPKKIKVRDTQPNALIYNLSGKELVEGSVKFNCGKVYYLAIKSEDGNWINHTNTTTDKKRCRGVKIYTVDFVEQVETIPQVEKRYAELKDEFPTEYIPIFQVKISNMRRLEGDHAIKIGPEEYVHNGSHEPSRAVRFQYGKDFINIGHVEEVPKRDARGGGPNAREHLGEVAGRGQMKNVRREYDYRFDCPNKNILFDWDVDSQRLKINFCTNFGKRYFDRPGAVGSTIQELAEKLYMSLQQPAGTLYQMAANGHIQTISDPRIVQNYNIGEGVNIDAWLYYINFFLTQSLAEPWIKVITDKMDALIDKMEAEAEVQLAAVAQIVV